MAVKPPFEIAATVYSARWPLPQNTPDWRATPIRGDARTAQPPTSNSILVAVPQDDLPIVRPTMRKDLH